MAIVTHIWGGYGHRNIYDDLFLFTRICGAWCKGTPYLPSSHISVTALATFLSEQLTICQKWLIDNKLSLHVGKTESMVFTSKRKRNGAEGFKIKCGESLINRVHCLSGDEHVTMNISKISSRISFLYRNAHLLSFRCRQTFCSALIQPYFDYCCSMLIMVDGPRC